MDAGPGTATVVSAAAGTALVFSAFGVTTTEFVLGAGMMLLGTLARTGFAVQAALEAGQKVNVAATIGALAASILTAPFLSALAFTVAKVFNFESDALIAVLLLAAGYGGPQLVKQIMDAVTKMLTSRLQPKDQSSNPGPKP
jgi:hypothetical protein